MITNDIDGEEFMQYIPIIIGNIVKFCRELSSSDERAVEISLKCINIATDEDDIKIGLKKLNLSTQRVFQLIVAELKENIIALYEVYMLQKTPETKQSVREESFVFLAREKQSN